MSSETLIKTLIVDPDTDRPTLIADILKSCLSYPITCLFAKNAIEAEEVIQENPPDLAIIAARLPDKPDGICLAQTLRKKPEFSNLPIVFILNDRGSTLVQRALAIEDAILLFQIFGAEEMIIAVNKALQQSLTA